jgi:hypothetical protein
MSIRTLGKAHMTELEPGDRRLSNAAHMQMAAIAYDMNHARKFVTGKSISRVSRSVSLNNRRKKGSR